MVKKERFADRIGLRLSRQALRVLRERGIFAQSSVSLHHQQLANRYVVRGVESGGAAGDIGRYVTFAQEDGRPIEYLHPVEAIGVNGVHSVVVAPVLVRLDMLRKGRTYELLITRHAAGQAENGRRPPLEDTVLFRGVHGDWNWICREQTRRRLARYCRRSIHSPARRLRYQRSLCRRCAQVSRQRTVAAVAIITMSVDRRREETEILPQTALRVRI